MLLIQWLQYHGTFFRVIYEVARNMCLGEFRFVCTSPLRKVRFDCYDLIHHIIHVLILRAHFTLPEYFQLFNLLGWSVLVTSFYYMNTA